MAFAGVKKRALQLGFDNLHCSGNVTSADDLPGSKRSQEGKLHSQSMTITNVLGSALRSFGTATEAIRIPFRSSFPSLTWRKDRACAELKKVLNGTTLFTLVRSNRNQIKLHGRADTCQAISRLTRNNAFGQTKWLFLCWLEFDDYSLGHYHVLKLISSMWKTFWGERRDNLQSEVYLRLQVAVVVACLTRIRPVFTIDGYSEPVDFCMDPADASVPRPGLVTRCLAFFDPIS